VNSLSKYSPVNSGMLISTTDFIEVGGYNEKVKLDFSDFQFIERFRKRNNSFFVLATSFQQDFSNDENDLFILNKRYISYCSSAANCQKSSLLDHIQYLLVVLVRGIMLAKRTRSLVFFKTFYKFYL
jgi:hypothetical protein